MDQVSLELARIRKLVTVGVLLLAAAISLDVFGLRLNLRMSKLYEKMGYSSTSADFSEQMNNLLMLGKYDDIGKASNNQLTKFPNDPWAYYYRGISNYHLNRTTEALADFEKVVSIEPSWERSVSGYMRKIKEASNPSSK